MTQEVSHGAATREPVYSGKRRVRGLWQRTLADGTIVYRGAAPDRRARQARPARSDDEDRRDPRARRRCASIATAASNGTARSRRRSTSSPTNGSSTCRRASVSATSGAATRSAPSTCTGSGSTRTSSTGSAAGASTSSPSTTCAGSSTGSRAQGLAPGTVTSCVNILVGLLRFALKRKVVAHNVVRDLDRDDRPGVEAAERAALPDRRRARAAARADERHVPAGRGDVRLRRAARVARRSGCAGATST